MIASASASASTSTGTSTATSIAVAQLGKRFGERWALRDVSFGALPGEIVAVIGPNGAGKTTLLSILAGIAEPTTGEIEHAAGSRAGWVPQQPAVYSRLTVSENLRLFARLERVADVEAAVAGMLDQADLRARADDELGSLSGGNRQRVNIAIGLVAAPAVLLLDEPSASLDPRQRERLWQFVSAHARRGTTVIFSTHDIVEAERYADRVLVLADGELLFSGRADELKQAVRAEPGGDAAARAAGGGEVREEAPRDDFEQAFVAFLRARGH